MESGAAHTKFISVKPIIIHYLHDISY